MGAIRHPRLIALDAGALIALETPGGRALLRRILTKDAAVVISAVALAQAWRAPTRQVLLARLVANEQTTIAAFGPAEAKRVGVLLARTGTADVVDAHVVLSARDHRANAIVTSDPGDLRRLDPAAVLHTI